MSRIHDRQKKLRTVCEPALRLARGTSPVLAATTAAPVPPLDTCDAERHQPYITDGEAVIWAMEIARDIIKGQSFEQDAALGLLLFERAYNGLRGVK